MRRNVLGILAIGLLLVAAYGWTNDGLARSAGNRYFFFSTCQRLGLLFGATWLAYPQLERVIASTSAASARFMLLMFILGAAILVRPRLIVLLGPIILVLIGLQLVGWFLREAGRRRD